MLLLMQLLVRNKKAASYKENKLLLKKMQKKLQSWERVLQLRADNKLKVDSLLNKYTWTLTGESKSSH